MPINKILESLKVQKNVFLLQPSKFLCDETICSSVNSEQSSFYYDDNHLSSLGSEELTDEIIKLIVSINKY